MQNLPTQYSTQESKLCPFSKTLAPKTQIHSVEDFYLKDHKEPFLIKDVKTLVGSSLAKSWTKNEILKLEGKAVDT